MKIDARTKIVGLLGYPIGHTLSPAMHNTGFRELGLNFVYLPFEVPPERLEGAIRGITSLGLVGVNVTIPYKEKVIGYLDRLAGDAEMISAVNTIYQRDGELIGDNTDGRGFLLSLAEAGVDPAGKGIFLLGAGGGARACAFMLANSGAGSIILTDKIIIKAGSLAKDLNQKFQVPTEIVSLDDIRMRHYIQRTDILINATPIGMYKGDRLLIDPDWLRPDIVVYDLIYNPGETPLLKAAREKKALAINGLGMLLHQGALSFELWTGEKPPIEAMRKAIETEIY